MEGTVSQEQRRNGDERSFFNHEEHDDHEGMRPFDWAAEGGLLAEAFVTANDRRSA